MYRQSAVSSVLYAPLIALAFQMQAGGFWARADDASEALYPGQYVTNCKPAPIVGCVCERDSTEQMPQLLQSTSESRPTRDIEYSRMIEWMRQTCIAVTQSGRPDSIQGIEAMPAR
jgi:hypothetical protein